MGKHSHISWTHHTFNPWWGCAKVSAGCENCYAETWARRVGSVAWGVSTPRRFFGDKHWEDPVRWNSEAIRKKKRFRVFCASMADVFEDRRDLDAPRARLWQLIDATPALDWLILTKRPESVSALAPWCNHWPANLWLGTTVENQRSAERRIPHLLANPARVHFLSCEPLLGPVDISTFLSRNESSSKRWVIVGGESGARARPMNPEWVRALRDSCRTHSVPFFFKQWGKWRPDQGNSASGKKTIVTGNISMVAGDKPTDDRTIDGASWDEIPEVTTD